MNREVAARVREAAGHRCGYCRAQQEYVLGPLEIDHLVPIARGGTDDEDNLWLACRVCNNSKGVKVDGLDPESERVVALFNPRRQRWQDHFRWDGVVVLGRTAVGRATVSAISLNNAAALDVRRRWAAVGWHPASDDT